MLEQFKSYFVKLRGLSSAELDRSAEKLVVAENGNIAKLIAHIAEISARKLALELGYKNLFGYCIRRLNLSEGAVPARIHVANVSRRFPQLLVALAENHISLTVASLLAAHVSEDNVDKLISDCAGMTRKETEEYLVALRPKPVFEPSIRKRPSARQPAAPPQQQPQDDKSSPQAPQPPLEQTPPKSSPPILQPANSDEFNFRFSADRDFKDKFERLAEVLGVENPQKHMAEILEKALDIALEKKDPKKKLERRKKRENSSKAKSRLNEIPKNDEPAKSRYISSEVSERVHARAGYQCEYRSPDGRRCTSRTGLQIEHVRPFGIYHSNDERFLELHCAAHNGLAAERVYGPAFIQRKTDERRTPSGADVAKPPGRRSGLTLVVSISLVTARLLRSFVQEIGSGAFVATGQSRRRGRPVARVQLQPEQSAESQQRVGAATSAQREALRVRIILVCADGFKTVEAARICAVHARPVERWRSRFLRLGFKGLEDRPRSWSQAKI